VLKCTGVRVQGRAEAEGRKAERADFRNQRTETREGKGGRMRDERGKEEG
jgi:hypothetical protein